MVAARRSMRMQAGLDVQRSCRSVSVADAASAIRLGKRQALRGEGHAEHLDCLGADTV